MPIVFLIDPDKKVRPEGAIRADVAWKLFLPDIMGDISTKYRKGLSKFVQWLWGELSDRLGFLRKAPAQDVYVITPPLTPAAMELVARIASMWSDAVHAIEKPDEGTDLKSAGKNLWTPPVINLGASSTPLIKSMTMEHHDGDTTFLMPALGSSKAFMRTYLIRRGMCYSRLHSHSAVEEHYFVLEGKGTLRYGAHSVDLISGDLVSKPIGPDNYSQFIADKGSEMKILDIEVWPDTRNDTKDAVLYPDHKELLLRGQGWGSIIQSDTLMPPDDFGINYDTGYERQKDGSWKAKKIPGLKERKSE